VTSREEQGFVLIAVLWLIALFTIVALGYARTTRYRAQEVVNELRLMQENRLQVAALEIAAAQYELYVKNRQRFLSSGLEDSLTPEQRSVMWYPRYETYALQMEEEEFFVRLTPVGGLIALHAMTPDLWFTMLEVCGVADEDARLAVMAAVADWEDEDGLLHLDGAEADYYAGLPVPYACKNAPMEHIEELLLVRGVTPEIFYGTQEHPGLRHFLCVDGEHAKLDINSASPLAFHIAAALTQDEIDVLTALRQENPFMTMAEAQEEVSLVGASELDRFFHVLHNPEHVLIQVGRDPDPGPGSRTGTRVIGE
jgi:general secretion pathway protein K